jgi:hypothetical protein
MLKRFRARPLGITAAVGTVTLMAGMVTALLPGGAAAAAEKEYTSKFEAPCVVGPGITNLHYIFKISTTSMGPATFTEGQEVTFSKTSSTIKTPPEAAEAFAALGASKVEGNVTNFVSEQTGLTPPSLNIGEPAAYPSGLPYVAPVEKGKEVTFTAPTGTSYSFGPLTVTGKAGSNGVLTLSSAPAFTEVESGVYKATGEGIIATASGYNSEGVKVIGPLKVTCNAPEGVVLGSAPIEKGTGGGGGTTTTTTTTTTTKSAEGPIEVNVNDTLTGSLTVKKLGEKITLPAGSTFKGKATIPGTLTGDTSVPPFKASVKLFGLLPTTLGVTFTEVGHATSTITPAAGGELTFKGSAKDNIGITGVGLLGLNIPVSCTTSSPVTFPLEATAPVSAIETGLTFSGTTTLPSVNCSGGLLGSLFGSVITELLAGPNNPFTLTIAP